MNRQRLNLQDWSIKLLVYERHAWVTDQSEVTLIVVHSFALFIPRNSRVIRFQFPLRNRCSDHWRVTYWSFCLFVIKNTLWLSRFEGEVVYFVNLLVSSVSLPTIRACISVTQRQQASKQASNRPDIHPVAPTIHKSLITVSLHLS
jgi:hypothetical protein